MEFESFEGYWGPYSAKDGPRSYAALAWVVKGRAPWRGASFRSPGREPGQR